MKHGRVQEVDTGHWQDGNISSSLVIKGMEGWIWLQLRAPGSGSLRVQTSDTGDKETSCPDLAAVCPKPQTYSSSGSLHNIYIIYII